MKFTYLVGTLVFLAIVNIVAVDTYLYYKLLRGPAEPSATAVTGIRSAVGGGNSVSKLDPAQKKELGRIKMEFREATAGFYRRIKELEDEIYALIQQDPVPREKIDRNINEHADLRLKLRRVAIAKMIETREVLNDAQKEELFRAIFRTPARPVVPADRADSTGGNQMMK